jgi:hypothetical protein
MQGKAVSYRSSNSVRSLRGTTRPRATNAGDGVHENPRPGLPSEPALIPEGNWVRLLLASAGMKGTPELSEAPHSSAPWKATQRRNGCEQPSHPTSRFPPPRDSIQKCEGLQQ